MNFTFFQSLADQIGDIPEDSIVSRTIKSDDNIKVVLFGFAKGQELSEHTAARQAVLHFIEGEAELTLGEEKSSAVAGTWVHMDPNLPHSVKATTPVTMLLLLL